MKSLSIAIAAVLFIALITLFVSCQKDQSVENVKFGSSGGGTAVYTLSGEGGNCAAPKINGAYIVGTAFQSSNTITLQVYVTAAGTYTFSTDVVDGFQFTTSGTFINTGSQTIILQGSGTPAGTGTFPFILSVGLGCVFFITVKNP